MIKNQWYAILPSKVVKNDGILAVKRLNLEKATKPCCLGVDRLFSTAGFGIN